MNEYHDLVLMCATAGAIYGSIRFDLKFVKYQLARLEKALADHLRNEHGK